MAQQICDLFPPDTCQRLTEVLESCPTCRKLIEIATKAGFDFSKQLEDLNRQEQAARVLRQEIYPHVP